MGKTIYAGDTVEVLLPWETHTPHQSKVFWNALDGAFINSHPAHNFLNDGKSKHRSLRDYMFQKDQPGVPMYDHPEDEKPSKRIKGFCRKVKSFYQQ